MKRVRICIFIFSVLVIFSVAVFAKTDYDLYEIELAVEETAKSFGACEYDKAEESSLRAREKWDEFARREYLLADKSNMVEIPLLLTQVEAEAAASADMAKSGGATQYDTEKRGEISARCYTLRLVIRSFRDKQKQLL